MRNPDRGNPLNNSIETIITFKDGFNKLYYKNKHNLNAN